MRPEGTRASRGAKKLKNLQKPKVLAWGLFALAIPDLPYVSASLASIGCWRGCYCSAYPRRGDSSEIIFTPVCPDSFLERIWTSLGATGPTRDWQPSASRQHENEPA